MNLRRNAAMPVSWCCQTLSSCRAWAKMEFHVSWLYFTRCGTCVEPRLLSLEARLACYAKHIGLSRIPLRRLF